ncbi:MAG TPA: glycosyltransferase 87 family protein, partial [Pyrinomonadaceae bacterium]
MVPYRSNRLLSDIYAPWLAFCLSDIPGCWCSLDSPGTDLCGSRDILYSPLVAAFFSPFAFVSQNVTEVLWRLVLGLALPLALWFNARTLFDFSKKEFAWLFLLIVPLTLSSLNNGQANIIIIVLFLVAAGAASQSRWFTCFLRRVRDLLENIPDRICLAAYRYFPEETDVSNPFGADRPLRCFALPSEAVLHTAAVWRLAGES